MKRATVAVFALTLCTALYAQSPAPPGTAIWVEAGKETEDAPLNAALVAGLNRTPDDYPLIITVTARWRAKTLAEISRYHDTRYVYESIKSQDGRYNPATGAFDELTRLDDPAYWGRYCELLLSVANEQRARGIERPIVHVDLEWICLKSGIGKWANPWPHIKWLDSELPEGTTLLLYPTGPGVRRAATDTTSNPQGWTALMLRVWTGLHCVVALDHDWAQRAWLRGELPAVGEVGGLQADSLTHYLKRSDLPSPWALVYTMYGIERPRFDWCWLPEQWHEAVLVNAARGAPVSVIYPGIANYERQARLMFPDFQPPEPNERYLERLLRLDAKTLAPAAADSPSPEVASELPAAPGLSWPLNPDVCLQGPDHHTCACWQADRDHDGDVDLHDFALSTARMDDGVTPQGAAGG